MEPPDEKQMREQTDFYDQNYLYTSLGKNGADQERYVTGSTNIDICSNYKSQRADSEFKVSCNIDKHQEN